MQGDKVEDVEFQLATGAGELAQAAVSVQRDGAVRPGQDLELASAVVDHQVSRTGCAGNAAVDFDAQVGGAGGQAVNADEADAASIGFEGAEAARGGGAAFCQHFGHQGQTKVNVGQVQADGVVCAAVDTGKGVNAAATDGEQVGGDFCGGFGFGQVFADDAVVELEGFGAFF